MTTPAKNKRWKPKVAHRYWRIFTDIDGKFEVGEFYWISADDLYNVFPTRKEAEKMAKKIRKLLRENG